MKKSFGCSLAIVPRGYEIEVQDLQEPNRNPVEHFLACLDAGRPVEGPLSVEISRIGQQIVDTAFRSAEEGRTLELLG